MIKEGAKKSSIKKSTPISSTNNSSSTSQTEKILVENFVALQKVIVSLSEKFTNLSSQISKLLELFETSAKTLAQEGFEDNKEIVNKLDSLLEQNKIIARGLALLHEEEEEIEEIPEQKSMQMPKEPRPMPKQMQSNPLMPKPQMPAMTRTPMPAKIPQMNKPMQQAISQTNEQPSNMQGYQKSISS